MNSKAWPNLEMLWNNFLTTGKKEFYKQIHSIDFSIKDNFIQVSKSAIFSERYNIVKAEINDFFLAKKSTLEFILKNDSRPLRNTLAKIYFDNNKIQEISVDDAKLSYRELFHQGLAQLFDRIDATNREKLEFLKNLSERSSEMGFKVGPSIYANCPFTLIEGFGLRFFIVSLTSPIDGVLLPSHHLFLRAKQQQYEVQRAIRQLFNYLLNNANELEFKKYTERRLLALIKDKRPAHVFFDELSGVYLAENETGESFLKVFSTAASYIEANSIPGSLGYWQSSEAINDLGKRHILFRCIERLYPGESGDRYRLWLKHLSLASYVAEVNALAGKNIFWIGFVGGERRSWLEEQQGIEKVVRWLRENIKNSYFVFDGYTGRLFSSESDHKHIDYHSQLLKDVVHNLELSDNEWCSVIGAQIMRKIAFASQCAFFITGAGTPSNWVSNVCKRPGVLHGNTVSLISNRANYDEASTYLVPKDIIQDLELNDDSVENISDAFLKSAALVNYSINPDAFLQFFKDSLFKEIKTSHGL